MTYDHIFLIVITYLCWRMIQQPVGEEIEQPVVHKPKQTAKPKQQRVA